MMSVSKGMAAEQAGGYFSREDYYLKGADQGGVSRWHGKGAESLGLTGPVREEEFRALCSGRHPATGERIVSPKLCRNKKTGQLFELHRAGNDCTFSAPKSVSIAYAAGVAGVREAHDAAVASVLEHLEKHYTHYRSPDGIRNGQLVAAAFDHASSRNLDPQLHSHLFIVNAVRAQDGSWKANWHKPIFQDQKSLGLLYRQELARELRTRGFEIEIVDRSQIFIELKGIDPQLIEHFSGRREAIERQVLSWREEGRFTGVPHGKLYEMAALETRDPKREVTRGDVEEIFRRGFRACGMSVDEVKHELERARDLALGTVPEAPEYAALEVVRLAAARLIEREAVLDRARLLDQAVLISGGRHGVKELNAAIDGGANGVLRLGQDGKGREYYTTVEMRRLEQSNLETIKGLQGFKSVTTPDEVHDFFHTVEQTDGISLTPGQMRQIENELVGCCAVGVTQGKAGTGKTLASHIIERFNSEVLKPQGKEHFTINVAFTGKAAQEMASASGRPAYTVDAFLNAYARGDVGLQAENRTMPIGEDGRERILIPRGAQVVLRVDEASFVGAKQASHLLRVVRDLQDQGVQAKLQLTGDTRQMQAIQSGDLFRQVLELGREGWADVAQLNEIRRQRDPDFLEVARTLNRDDLLPGESASEALGILQRRGEVVELPHREELIKAAVERYLVESGKPFPDVGNSAGAGQSVLLITSTNADRIELNRAIREARIAAGEIEQGKSYTVLTPAPQGGTADSYRLGDEVHFSGYRGEDGKMQRWGARLNTVGKVTGVEPERDRVAVTYSFTSRNGSGAEVVKTVTKKLPAAEMVGKTTVYREEERTFAVGDRVIALKNDRELGVQNGTAGVLQGFDDKGRVVVDLGGREITVDLTRYRHLDHAYAVTIHKSQGATVDRAIVFAPVLKRGEQSAELGELPAPGSECYGRSSYNALNVAVTRARYGASVFTNSLPDLMREVQHVEVKTSTLNPLAPQVPPALPRPGKGEPVKDLDHSSGLHLSVLEREKAAVGEAPERRAASGPLREGISRGQGGIGTGRRTIGNDSFDGGAKISRSLDQLREVTRSARTLPQDIITRPLPGAPALGKEIVARQVAPASVKAIDQELGKR